MNTCVASAVLWVEDRRDDLANVEWDNVMPPLLIGAFIALVEVMIALVILGIKYGDLDKAPEAAFWRWCITLWVATGLGAAWWKLHVWRRIVKWANAPKRVADKLRDSK